MKKMIRLGLCLGLLSAALTCTALAADDEYTTNIDGTVTYEGGSYSASYSGAQEGKQYALLVVEGTPDKYSVSEDTIVYIDQQQATETGVSFNHWIPMSTPDCVVLLGGVFDGNVPSPVVLGTLEGQGVTVSGTVKYQTVGTMFRPATVELHNEQGSLIAQTQTDVNGKYSFASIPVGKGYKIVIKKLGYLTYTDVGINILDTCTICERFFHIAVGI